MTMLSETEHWQKYARDFREWDKAQGNNYSVQSHYIKNDLGEAVLTPIIVKDLASKNVDPNERFRVFMKARNINEENYEILSNAVIKILPQE